MNFLVYDETRQVDRLARSLLIGLRHRVSISVDPEDARLKIGTALFDALVFGPGGAPRELAEFIDGDFSHLPIVLLGLNTQPEATPRIHAALRSPISPAQFTIAIHRLQRKLSMGERALEVAVDVADDSAHLLCKATRLSRSAMMLEGVAPAVEGVPDEFTDFFEAREQSTVTATFRAGEETVRVPGAVAFAEWTPARAVRLVGVRFAQPLSDPVIQGLGLVA